MTVFNLKQFDATKEPMFFGEECNVSRYDVQRYPIFEKLIEKQLSFFWRPEEVDLTRDRKEFVDLPEHEKHIFLSNLKYQTLLDSVQGRSPNLAFLPMVSIPELETWIETWAFSECLAEGTEVLTNKGWKDLGDTTTEDSCLVYDLKDDSVFFEKPKRVVQYDMDTDLIRYKSKNPKQFDQLVTPNHRMPVKHRKNKPHHEEKRYFKEAIEQDYQAHHLAPISGYVKEREDSVQNLSPLHRVFIAAQADGSVSKRYTGEKCGTIPVWFSFQKQRKVDRLKTICKQAGLVLHTLQKDKRDGKQRFKVDIPTAELAGAELKDMASWVKLEKVSELWAREFLYEVSQWDSHRYTDDVDGTFCYTTTIKSNCDIVQAVSCLCGKSPRLNVRSDDRNANFRDVYELNIVDSANKDGQSIEREYEKYKGKVRCLETSTGAFLIRYNGVVSVTGNTIHSRSYTHIIRNVVGDPSIIFDSIVDTAEIVKRAGSVSKHYDAVIKAYHDYKEGRVPLRAVKKALYLCMVAVNVLEGIRFYVSFACSWAFAERAIMEGNAKIIKLIARDEALHLTGTQNILNHLASGNDDPEFREIAIECREEAIQIFQEAAQEEKEWTSYLFQYGSMLGLNKQILDMYIDHITNIRAKAVGFDNIFEETRNPITWINTWLSSENVQVAPQESEISSYLVGQLNSEITDGDFDDFDF